MDMKWNVVEKNNNDNEITGSFHSSLIPISARMFWRNELLKWNANKLELELKPVIEWCIKIWRIACWFAESNPELNQSNFNCIH